MVLPKPGLEKLAPRYKFTNKEIRMFFKAFPAIRLFDAPNALTIFNASLGILAVGSAQRGHVQLCATLIFVAALLDYVDGHLARRYFNKKTDNREFGRQLDTLADLLNFGVAPGVSMLAIFHDASFSLPVCVFLILSSTLRLALFNVLSEKNTAGYVGVPTTYSGFALANCLFLYASQHLIKEAVLGIAVVLSIAQVSNIPIRKIPVHIIIPVMILIFSITVIYTKTF
jgi:CDP-diacylglycerol---serine O-phosphatidyltransferase